MPHHRQVRELPQLGHIGAALLNIPVMASALAACYLGLWLAQPEAPPVRRASASPETMAVADPTAADASTSPAR